MIKFKKFIFYQITDRSKVDSLKSKKNLTSENFLFEYDYIVCKIFEQPKLDNLNKVRDPIILEGVREWCSIRENIWYNIYRINYKYIHILSLIFIKNFSTHLLFHWQLLLISMSTLSRSIADGAEFVGRLNITFRIVHNISHGGYGAVYEVTSSRDDGRYALKLEQRQYTRDHYKLMMEVQVLREAGERPENARKHFPTLIDNSDPMPNHMFLVMSLLGRSLADIKRGRQHKIFSPSTGYYCAIQSLEAIRDLHDLGYVHRDIKPGNFVIGLPRTQFQNIVYMVDFGIARKFIGADGRIRNPRDRTKFKGTVRFASLSMHEGNEVGRKDDCESWIYMIIDLIDQERLPWHNVEDKRRLRKLKAEALKAPRSLFKREEEDDLRGIITYLQSLHYVDIVDYSWMREMVKRVAKRLGCTLQEPYDWQLTPTTTST
ncbi:Protein kinase domain-containing protein [Meloidogyne graminicola]|uniref:non-specific serine/threonine protein kinase n=1 Tax=Meloidogyne graminicola TaxID=189291 RepID=A0A8S9ZXF7_9BILA|nr:Protein kinase domain-containing protein [Meloidogyne graminicola]